MNSIKNEVQFSKNSLTLENVELSKGYKKLFSNFNLKFKYGKIYLVFFLWMKKTEHHQLLKYQSSGRSEKNHL